MDVALKVYFFFPSFKLAKNFAVSKANSSKLISNKNNATLTRQSGMKSLKSNQCCIFIAYRDHSYHTKARTLVTFTIWRCFIDLNYKFLVLKDSRRLLHSVGCVHCQAVCKYVSFRIML